MQQAPGPRESPQVEGLAPHAAVAGAPASGAGAGSEDRELLRQVSAMAARAFGLARTHDQGLEGLVAVLADVFKDGHSKLRSH